MAKPPSNAAASTEGVMVPFERVTGLVRHLTHEIRNGLNTIDLQAAFLQELVPADGEAAPEIKRVRTMITSTAKMLQAFSATFSVAEPHPVTYSAKMLVEDFRARLDKLLPDKAPQIEWTIELGEETISVDLEMIFRAFMEVFKNAAHFYEKDQPISTRVFAKGGRLILELSEGKSAVPSPPESWGSEPLVSTRRGGFGMGLFHARRIFAVHQGRIESTFDPAARQLTTRLSLPLAAG
jgi:nitrogen-specific signal transduction histidine kinase